MNSLILEPWWKIITPKEYILSPTFNESLFTIDLSTVVMNAGPEIYINPLEFFSMTTITSSLYNLFVTVLDHLTENGLNGKVIQLEAGFGGGKTHSLVALYHLIHSATLLINSNVFENAFYEHLRKINLNMIQKCKIISIIGTSLRTTAIRHLENEFFIKTLWGELAYQLGGIEVYRKFQEDDQNYLSPGVELLASILKQFSPVIILIDELLSYLVKAKGVKTNNQHSNLQTQTLVFLQELTQAVVKTTNTVLIISLPSNSLEVPDTLSEDLLTSAKNIIRTHSSNDIDLLLKRSKKITGRIVEKYTPYNDIEIFQIIRKRLFDPIEDKKDLITSLINTYISYYKKFSSYFPLEVSTNQYKQMMLYSYPFHPELIEYLRSIWLIHPEYQGIRGMLKFLAILIQDHYYSKTSYILIHSGSINLNSEKILLELSIIGNTSISNVIKADITGSDVSNTKLVDTKLQPELKSKFIATQIAQAILLHSLHNFIGLSNDLKSKFQDLTIKKLRLAIANPEIPYPLIDHVVELLLQNCWYLHESRSMFVFNDQPNLNKYLIEYEDISFSSTQQLNQLKRVIDSYINIYISNSKVQAKYFLFPSDVALDIPDEPKIRLIFLDDNYALDNTLTTNKDMNVKIDKIFAIYKKRRRIYNNSLILIAPDKEFFQEAMNLQLKLHSAIKMHQDIEKGIFSANIDLLNLASKIQLLNSTLSNLVKQIFRYLILKEDTSFHILDLYPALTSNSSLVEIIFQRLYDEHKLISNLHPKIMIDRYNIFDANGTIALIKLRNFFHQYSPFPLLDDENKVLKESIKQGIEQQLFDIIYKDPITNIFHNFPPDNKNLNEQEDLFIENIYLKLKTVENSSSVTHDEILARTSPFVQISPKIQFNSLPMNDISPKTQIHSINNVFYTIDYNNKDLFKLIQFVNFLVQKAEIVDLNIKIKLQSQQGFNDSDIDAIQNLENQLISENPDIRINKRFL